jgi:hypothetical protein
MPIINNTHCFFYLFFIIGNPSRHFVYITKKVVRWTPSRYRKINWQNPASISAYTQSEYRISNYVNHIRIIIWNRHGHECSLIWKLSGNFIKMCRDFLGWDILGTTFFRAESSLIQSSCRSSIVTTLPFSLPCK